MTEVEKTYLAGTIDGEGSIMLQRLHNVEYPSPCVIYLMMKHSSMSQLLLSYL